MVAITASAVRSTVIAPPAQATGFLLYGQDDLQIGALAETLSKAIKAKTGGEVVRLDDGDISADPDRIAVELTTRSLFGGKTIVWLSSCPAKAQAVLLEVAAQPLLIDAFLIVQAPDLKKSHKLTQLFESSRTLAALPCYGEDKGGIEREIRDLLKALGHEADGDAVTLIAERSNRSAALARPEIEKLSAFAGAGKRIVAADVEAALSDQQTSETFDVIDAALDGRGQEAMAAFDRLMAKDQAVTALLILLSSALQRLHGLCLAVEAGGSPSLAVKQLRPPVFFKQQDTLLRQLKLWRSPELMAVWLQCNVTMKETRLRPAFAEALTMKLVMEIAQTAKSLRGR